MTLGEALDDIIGATSNAALAAAGQSVEWRLALAFAIVPESGVETVPGVALRDWWDGRFGVPVDRNYTRAACELAMRTEFEREISPEFLLAVKKALGA
jgi:hypothetical protein